MAGASLQHPVAAPQHTATAADDSLREGEAEAGAETEREGGVESAVEDAAGVGMSGSALLRVGVETKREQKGQKGEQKIPALVVAIDTHAARTHTFDMPCTTFFFRARGRMRSRKNKRNMP
jgi:hypothetical protein